MKSARPRVENLGPFVAPPDKAPSGGVITKADQLTWWLFSIDDVQAAFAGVGRPWIKRVLVDTAHSEMRRLAVDVDFGVSNPRVGEFVDKWNGKFSRSVTKHTYDDLRTTLQQGLDDGENTYKLRKRVEATMRTKRAHEAERIARTETTRAYEGGRLEAWRQSGVVIGREWVASADACEFCEALNGTVMRDLDTPFIGEGASYGGAAGGAMVAGYGDVMHPPAHPHCTCTTLEVLVGE